MRSLGAEKQSELEIIKLRRTPEKKNLTVNLTLWGLRWHIYTPLRYVVNRRRAPTVKGNLTLGYLKGGTYPFTLGYLYRRAPDG